MTVVGIVGCGAGGVEELRTGLVEPAIGRGWQVGVTLTPTAAVWLDVLGETDRLAQVTGLPVRSAPRLPTDQSPHPPVDCYAVAPASANTVAKLALGLADNQALTQLCEAIGGRAVPVVVFPRINAAHAGQPAWNSHIDALRNAGVRLVYGEDVWPLHTPRNPLGKKIPWGTILDTISDTVRLAGNNR